MNTVIDIDVATRVLATVDAGLVSGLGEQKPGSMCVEAAVCYALGLPHGDDPQCVSRALRSFKIRLNDSGWSSKEARAKGLRRLAVAQLGSRDTLDDKEFARRVGELAIRKAVPMALRASASVQEDSNHKSALLLAADMCEREGSGASAADAYAAAKPAAYAAYAADAATYAAYAAAAAAKRDAVLAEFAEDVVSILKDMGAPGCQWLSLTEGAV